MLLKKNQEEPLNDELQMENRDADDTQKINRKDDNTAQIDWEALAKEYLTDLKRVQADFENYKKRQQESQKELRGILVEQLILDIVPVLDNFRTATEHVPDEQKSSPWVIGIQYIEKQLETVLTDNGIQTIEVKEGEEFDPSIHEALDREQGTGNREQGAENNEQKGHVVANVIQKGYKFGERVIRPAKVIVK